MKCPHCGTELVWIHNELCRISTGQVHPIEKGGPYVEEWSLSHKQCGECNKPLLVMIRHRFLDLDRNELPLAAGEIGEPKLETLWPRTGWREHCPPEVPEEVAVDYNEACAVIDISPTAAAALARRGLELLLRKVGAKGKTLSELIKYVIEQEMAPARVTADFRALLDIGNQFAAHANRAVTGEVLRASAEEAEWTLNTLLTALRYFYLEEAEAKARKAALDKKLAKLGERSGKTKK